MKDNPKGKGKAGRPPLPENKAKHVIVNARLTLPESIALKGYAKRHGLTVSEALLGPLREKMAAEQGERPRQSRKKQKGE
jgi:hypothetical protein